MDFNKIIETIVYWISTYSLKIVSAALIFIVGRWLIKRMTHMIGKLLDKGKLDATIKSFLSNIVYYALFAVMLMAVARQVGIDTSSFLAILGAAGLAIGLSLRNSLANFASGVMLILFRPFELGDVVTTGDITGKIDKIGTFSTVMSTLDNQKVIVPNEGLTGATIINATANSERRVDISLTIKGNIVKAIELIKSIVKQDERVLAEPEPVIGVSGTSEDGEGINIVVRPWVKTQDYWNVYFGLNEKIAAALFPLSGTV
jgi:small conductance mechanosensitive channel